MVTGDLYDFPRSSSHLLAVLLQALGPCVRCRVRVDILKKPRQEIGVQAIESTEKRRKFLAIGWLQLREMIDDSGSVRFDCRQGHVLGDIGDPGERPRLQFPVRVVVPREVEPPAPPNDGNRGFRGDPRHNWIDVFDLGCMFGHPLADGSAGSADQERADQEPKLPPRFLSISR